MRLARLVGCLGVLLTAVLPAAAAERPQTFLSGQAFRVAGTRVGCAVRGASTAPRMICGLWGRRTRSIEGTMSIVIDEQDVDVFQRPLDGPPSLLRELPQPARSGPPKVSPAGGSRGTRTLSYGDVVNLSGTDISCVVARRASLGVRCVLADPETGQLVASSAAVMFTAQGVLALRVNPKGIPSTVFYQRQPFLPSPATVARERRALARAAERLAALRSASHGSRAGYLKALALFDAIDDDLAGDRYIHACLRFTPLLYNGFYLPRGSVRFGAGHRYLASVERIERALCS